MWFKSAKSIKENPENKILLFVTGMHILSSYDKRSNIENHQFREAFVDSWLREEEVQMVRVNTDKEILEVETLLKLMENVGKHD